MTSSGTCPGGKRPACLCSLLTAGGSLLSTWQPYVTITTSLPSRMWYCQQSSHGPALTCQPVSSPISRTTQSRGSSPSSSFPPGSSHSFRSFSSSSTLPSWTATPLTETGNACAAG